MILTGNEIENQVKLGRIKIEKFDPKYVSTNSYDLVLGNKILTYTGDLLDPKIDNNHLICNIPSEGLQMKPGDFILGETAVAIGSDNYVGIIHAKSGIARLGLFVHVTADLLDIGYYGKLTFQLYATLPLVIYPGMPVGQITFWVPRGEIVLYNGKYQNGLGPQSSKVYLDLRENTCDM